MRLNLPLTTGDGLWEPGCMLNKVLVQIMKREKCGRLAE